MANTGGKDSKEKCRREKIEQRTLNLQGRTQDQVKKQMEEN